MRPHRDRLRAAAGWSAVAVTTVLACLWGFWGGIEAFHEGWYDRSLARNLGMTFVQYLGPMLVFALAGLAGVLAPRVGAAIHFTLAIGAAYFFRGAAPMVVYPFIVGPITLLGVAYAWGRPTNRRWESLPFASLPIATTTVSGAGPAWRVEHRLDDGDRGARHLTANGLDLTWAPAGPGWPDSGVSWDEAVRRCRFLDEEGTALADTPQDIWRLPTVEEAVRAQCRGGENAGGSWDGKASSYRQTPDKETPLWDPRSKVIYWWTATEVDAKTAYIVVYDGKVWPRPKSAYWGYLGFRAVKVPSPDLPR